MSHWWRAHDDAVDNAKLCLLSDKQHRAWFNLMCLASEHGGALPDLKVIAIKLRMSAGKAQGLLDQMIGARLFDRDEAGAITPHNWGERQFKSDGTDPTGAVRQKRYRDRHRNGENNGVTTVTDKRPETETETETETEKREEPVAADAAPTAPKSYAFEFGVIRLTEKDFEQWKQHFSHIDLGAELIALEPWAAQQPKWFHAVSGALAKRNREIGVRKSQQKAEGEFQWKSGIPGVV